METIIKQTNKQANKEKQTWKQYRDYDTGSWGAMSSGFVAQLPQLWLRLQEPELQRVCCELFCPRNGYIN